MAFVMAAIILLLLTLGLLFFINTVFQKTKEAVPEQTCQVSVEREAQINMIAKQAGAGHTPKDFASNVECQTIPIDLKGSDAQWVTGMTGVFMEKCWKMFSQGRLELFSREQGTFCHICYALTPAPGTTLALEDALKNKRWSVRYDVPQQLASEKYGIIFLYKRAENGDVTQQVVVRALDPTQPQALEVCAGAEFPRQRT